MFSIRIVAGFIAFFLSGISCSMAEDENFNIENSSLIAVPKRIEQSVRKIISSELKECDFVGESITLKGEKSRLAYFITARGKGCQGNSSGPIWVVDAISITPNLLLEGSGMSVEFGDQSHLGLKDLKISSGNASHAIIQYWNFDGNSFHLDKHRDWIFPADCSQGRDNPENPFKCTSAK